MKSISPKKEFNVIRTNALIYNNKILYGKRCAMHTKRLNDYIYVLRAHQGWSFFCWFDYWLDGKKNNETWCLSIHEHQWWYCKSTLYNIFYWIKMSIRSVFLNCTWITCFVHKYNLIIKNLTLGLHSTVKREGNDDLKLNLNT